MNPGDEYRPFKLFYNVACVPFSLLKYPDISLGAKVTCGVLAAHQGKDGDCFVDRDTLAAELGVSVPTIDRWLKELVDHKFIRRDQKGAGRPATCVFLWHPILAESLKAQSAVIGQAPSSVIGQNPALSPAIRKQPVSPIKIEGQPYQNGDSALSKLKWLKGEKAQEKAQEKAHIHSARVTAADMNGQASQRFAEAWEKWPGHKARKNRAAQMWVSVVSVAIEDQVFACLDRFCASDLVARGMVGYMDRWLQEQNADAWENTWLAPRTQQQPRSRQQENVDGFKTA
jgi:hypothetical protein